MVASSSLARCSRRLTQAMSYSLCPSIRRGCAPGKQSPSATRLGRIMSTFTALCGVTATAPSPHAATRTRAQTRRPCLPRTSWVCPGCACRGSACRNTGGGITTMPRSVSPSSSWPRRCGPSPQRHAGRQYQSVGIAGRSLLRRQPGHVGGDRYLVSAPPFRLVQRNIRGTDQALAYGSAAAHRRDAHASGHAWLPWRRFDGGA